MEAEYIQLIGMLKEEAETLRAEKEEIDAQWKESTKEVNSLQEQLQDTKHKVSQQASDLAACEARVLDANAAAKRLEERLAALEREKTDLVCIANTCAGLCGHEMHGSRRMRSTSPSWSNTNNANQLSLLE